MGNQTSTESAPARKWAHIWASLTVCATLILLALGAIVTTFRVGMADPVWPTYPWHLLLISWEEPSAGFLIEHTHRLAGYMVGMCVIGLAVCLWRLPGLRWLGIAALVAVIVQGLLGGFRVRLNALVGTDLAIIHGSFAQVVFALLVSAAVTTAAGWSADEVPEGNSRVRWISLLTTGFIFLQIVLGGLVRHTHSPLGQRGHLLVAFGVVALVILLWKSVADSQADRGLRFHAHLLLVLVCLQIVLGVESWLMKFDQGMYADLKPITIGQAATRTAHFLIGSCVFGSAVAVSLRAHRQPAHASVPAPMQRLEGAL